MRNNVLKLKLCLVAVIVLLSSCAKSNRYEGMIFDTHLHYTPDVDKQLADFEKHQIIKGALSSAWDNQERYRGKGKTEFLIGLMFPCPNGIVPYSGQKCFSDGEAYPDSAWVRQQITENKIHFVGELLNEYYGISPSDSSMFPYYELALEFKLPVGIHTGLAGPNHLSPNYNPEMGDPVLMKKILDRYPGIKIWIMHAGAPYLKGTLETLKNYPQVFADISVLANPDITSKENFSSYMKSLIDAGFEDRLMFGSDNGDLGKMIQAVNDLEFLSIDQKEKIFLKNAETFFARGH